LNLPHRFLAIIFSILLLGCSAPGTTEAQPVNREPLRLHPAPVQTNLGQDLPISAQITIAGEVIQLEVAETPDQQQIGLMYRESLAANRGMLFPFNPPRPVRFWMKNTLIPLDMVFLRDGIIQAIIANVPPCKQDPCTSYGPASLTEIDQVIELQTGRAAGLGLKAGDRLTVQSLAPSPQPSASDRLPRK
jgi:uncharacterized membrane protein (UPF0127 family)